jgi:hypothetical protein
MLRLAGDYASLEINQRTAFDVVDIVTSRRAVYMMRYL